METKQPYDIEIEKAVIAACIIEPKKYYSISSILSPLHFYDIKNKLIFEAISQIAKDSYAKIDILTVTEKLKSNGKLEQIGGSFAIVEMTMLVSSASHVEYHAKIIREYYIRRQAYSVLLQNLSKCYDLTSDISETIAKTQAETMALFDLETAKISTLSNAIDEVYQSIDFNLENRGKLTGIGTGLEKYDYFTGGMHESDLIIIAAETSQGKTSLALSIINNATSMFGASIAFYSLEMTSKQLAARMISQKSNISSKDILTRPLDNASIKQVDIGVNKLLNSKIYFDDRSSSSIDSIVQSIRMMKIKYNIHGVVIDYLQLVRSNSKGTKEEQIADIARTLKNIAKEIGIFVILLSQLSRNQENPRPTLARLRGSGQIEEAADQVIFVYRPEYYNKHYGKDINYPNELSNYPTEGTAMIDIAKGRNTGVFSFICSFDPVRTHFYTLDESNINFKTNVDPF